MITRISLKNWKSHLDSEFDFTKGVNALIGIMGSGKTSVVQGMTFALFGTFPALQSRRIGLDDLIMKKPQNKRTAEVSLDFQADGKKYSIKRVIELGKGTTHAEIREDDRLLDVNSQGVNRVVQDVLQLDYDLFSRAIYSEQNRLDYFLTIPKGQRTQHIDRMLKLDRFEKVREGSVSLANRITHSRTEKLKLLGELEKENVREKIEAALEDVRTLEEKKGVMEKNLRSAKEKRETLNDTVSNLDDVLEEENKIKTEIESIKSRLKEIKENLNDKEKRLKNMGIDDLPNELRKVEKEVEILDDEIRKRRGEFEDDRERVANINAEVKILKDQILEMDRLGDRCPTCESEITVDKRRRLVDVRKGRDMILRNKVNNLVKEMEKAKKHIELLEKEMHERVLKKERMNSLIEDMDYVKEVDIRRKEYDEKEASLGMSLEAVQRKIGDVNVKDLREELQERIAEEREIITRLSNMDEKIKDRNGILQDMRRRENMLRRYKDDIEKDETINKRLNTFIKVLKVTQDQLRQEFLKTVNHSMGVIWSELYPYEDFSDVRLTIDKDYVLQLKGSEGWVSVEGVVSGGERSLACLALRIAFSMALVPNLKWLILDEPTHNLDVNAIEKFTGVLRERINNFVEQVFLITHEDRVSEGALGSLYKLDRNKELNEPTRVVGI